VVFPSAADLFADAPLESVAAHSMAARCLAGPDSDDPEADRSALAVR